LIFKKHLEHLRFMNNQPDGIRSSSDKPLETEDALQEAQKLINKIWIRQRLITLSIGGGIAAVAIAVLVGIYYIGHSEFHPIKTDSLGSQVAVDALQGARQYPIILSSICAFIIAIVGGVITLVQLGKLLLGPPRAGITAEKTIRQFYKKVLNEESLSSMWRNLQIDVAAFACLLNKGQHDMGGWRGFNDYWKKTNREIEDQLFAERQDLFEKWAGRKDLFDNKTNKLEAIRVKNLSKGHALYELDIAFSVVIKYREAQSKSQQIISKTFGPIHYIVRGEITQIGERWYLCSGKWNGLASA
jgi:hypothetical protein